MWFTDSITKTINDYTGITSLKEAEKTRIEWILENIEDPLAREIAWTPLLMGWTSFWSHIICMNPQGNLEFRISKFFKNLMIGIITVLMIIDSFLLLTFFTSNTISLQWIFLMSLFLVGTIFMYRYFSRPLVFDKQNGYFYRKKPKMAYGLIDPTDASIIPLSSIYAIQIMTEKVYNKNSSFLSHEINLVLDSKKRVNVVDHADFESILADSKQLGEYLGVPVWGA